MKIDCETLPLDEATLKEIRRLLALPQEDRTDLEQMWFLMDRIWDEYGCDNKHPDRDKINRYYSHPVWVLNGLFLEQHEISMRHRQAISDWITEAGLQSIVDYGGGFGTLAKLIAVKNPACKVDVYEPYPVAPVARQLENTGRIFFVRTLSRYDCLVSTDVLEHVTDPLSVFAEMVDAVAEKGFLIIANNFKPVVKCHLPQTFHLRYSFEFIAARMGVKKMGHLDGSHAWIYQKEKSVENALRKVRKYEALSKILFPFFQSGYAVVNCFRNGLR